MIRCDKNRNGGSVAYFIRSNIGYLQKKNFQKKIENILVEILLPKTKPLIVGTIYRPFNKVNFLKIIKGNFERLDTSIKELYILGDLNVNIYQNNKYIARDDGKIPSNFLSNDIKTYHQFCTMHALKQLTKFPTCVTCSTSTQIDHILVSFTSRISQKSVIDLGFSCENRKYPLAFD